MADIKKFLDKAGVSTLWGQVAANLEAEAARAKAAEAEAKAAAKAAQDDVDALEALVGVLPEGTAATTVVEYVNKMALSYPGIRFNLINNGKSILFTDGSNNLLKVISRVYGVDVARKMFNIKEGDTLMVMGDKEKGIALIKDDVFYQLMGAMFNNDNSNKD